MSASIAALDRPPWWPALHSEACVEANTYDGRGRCDCDDWLKLARRVRANPVYPELLERYRAARKAWDYLRPRLVIPMEMRTYCDAYVNQGGPITYSGNSANVVDGLWIGVVIDRAWEDSGMRS